MKKISILGSTGSIGTQTLDIVRNNPQDFKVLGLASFNEVDQMLKQIEEFKPEAVCLFDKEAAGKLQEKAEVEVLSGEKGLEKIAALADVERVVNSVVGNVGIFPTIEAIKAGKSVALANKETLVIAGTIVKKELEKRDSELIPIDSEHSALFQSLKSGKASEVRRLILTMGKGNIAKKSKEELENVSVKDVFDRPAWNMGTKITIDSATCINKVFEIIETHWLFGVPAEKIEVIVHPDYVCHSLVEFLDGSIITEFGTPDMRRYTQYALYYPDRNTHAQKDLFMELKDKALHFEAPQNDKFPCLGLGHEVLRIGGTMPAVMHGADTSAAWAFYEGKIKFTQVFDVIKATMDKHKTIKNPSLEEIIHAEKWAEEESKKTVEEGF